MNGVVHSDDTRFIIRVISSDAASIAPGRSLIDMTTTAHPRATGSAIPEVVDDGLARRQGKLTKYATEAIGTPFLSPIHRLPSRQRTFAGEREP